jgi:putative flippase GtrA
MLLLDCARAGVAGQAVRFLLVGGVATGVDVALFNVLRVQVARYVAVTAVGLGLALAPIAVARYVLGLEGAVAMNVAANVVGLGLATVFRFYGYRRWVFAPQDGAPAPTAAGTRSTSR